VVIWSHFGQLLSNFLEDPKYLLNDVVFARTLAAQVVSIWNGPFSDQRNPDSNLQNSQQPFIRAGGYLVTFWPSFLTSREDFCTIPIIF